jgi:hypothetical protein
VAEDYDERSVPAVSLRERITHESPLRLQDGLTSPGRHNSTVHIATRATAFDFPRVIEGGTSLSVACSHFALRLRVSPENEAWTKGGCAYSVCLCRIERADERTRTADLISLRVIHRALQGFARASKSRVSRRLSLLGIAPRCTLLRSRWYRSGVDITFVPDKDFLARPRPINVVQRSRGAP